VKLYTILYTPALETSRKWLVNVDSCIVKFPQVLHLHGRNVSTLITVTSDMSGIIQEW